MNTFKLPKVLTPRETIQEEAIPKTKAAIFVLSGTIDSIDKAKLKAIEAHLRKFSGDANLTRGAIFEDSSGDRDPTPSRT